MHSHHFIPSRLFGAGRRLLLAAVMLLCAFTALHAAEAHYGDFYQQWRGTDPDTLIKQAYKCMQHGDTERALMFYRLITNDIDSKADRKTARQYVTAFNDQGAVFMAMNGNNQRAYENFMSALELVEKYNFEDVYPYVYTNIGDIYQGMHEYAMAMDYHRRALNAAIANSDWYITGVITENILTYIVSQSDAKQYTDVLATLEGAQVDPNDPSGPFITGSARVLRLMQQDSLASAINAINHLKTCVNQKMYEFPDQILFDLGYCIMAVHRRMGNLRAAIAEGKRCERLGESGHEDNEKMMALDKMISELYRHTGNIDSAYLYWDKAYQIGSTEADENSRATRVRSMQSLYDLNKKNEEINRANDRNRQLAIVITLGTAFTLLILALLIILYRQKRTLARQHRDLFRRNADVMKQEEVERKQLQRYQKHIQQQDHTIQQLQQQLQATDQEQAPATTDEKYAGSSLDEAHKLDLLNRVQTVMENNDEIFTPDFTINRLATLTDSNVKYISQVINEFYQKNFSTYLNEFRIHEACKKLADPDQRGQFTIEAISTSVGFKSRSGFSKVFKKVTGLTPSDYIKIAAQNDDFGVNS